MKIRPLHDRVIVKRLEEERTTASGISFLIPPPKNQTLVRSLPLEPAKFSMMEIIRRWM